MAEFMVKASELSARAADLRSLKEQLQTKSGEYFEKGNALSASFEGDTASLFLKEVNDHVNKMTEFVNLVERYCEEMEKIAARYAKADSDASEVVKGKNY